MTDVTTHLFYGLFVTTTSLIIASKALAKVQGPLLAINLILQRESTSTLQSTVGSRSSSYVTSLPAEVWEMIKGELISIELVEEENEFVFEHLCDHCRGVCGEECFCGTELDDVPKTWDEFIGARCDICFDDFLNGDRLKIISNSPTFKSIISLLSAYQISPIENIEVSGPEFFDFNPLSAVGFEFQNQECHHFEECTPFHAITTISASKFDLPFSVDYISRQFKLLLRDYGLKIGDHKEKTERSQVVATDEKKKEENRKIELKKDSNEPKWHLWTYGINDF